MLKLYNWGYNAKEKINFISYICMYKREHGKTEKEAIADENSSLDWEKILIWENFLHEFGE